MDESEQSFKTIDEYSRKIGYKEGITAGREVNFQHSFDKGYKEGLKNGFLLGSLKGQIYYKTNFKTELQTLPNILQRTTRGGCKVCEDPELLNTKTLSEIVDIQNKVIDESVQSIKTDFEIKN